MLEGGLVFVPFFALMFGIVDYGMAIFLRNTFQHATREGARYAVTFQTMSGMGQDASIKAVVQDAAMGFLNGTTGANMIKIKYYKTTCPPAPTTCVLLGEDTTPTANQPGSVVEISIEGYTWGVVAPLLRSANPIPLTARSSDRMESLPGGVAPPAR